MHITPLAPSHNWRQAITVRYPGAKDNPLSNSAKRAVREWYDDAYKAGGFSAQRRYPNEEFLRFLGRHYFDLAPTKRRDVSILEVGCGSGANIWMLGREGFDAHGIDLSTEGLSLCTEMLKKWGTEATLKLADMTQIPYPNECFDVIADVYSSYCLPEREFEQFLAEVKRLLRSGGRFFSYMPSKECDAFKNPGPARLIDNSTLDGIRRPDSPYFGNLFPVRFISQVEYIAALRRHGLDVVYCETVGRTYRNGDEFFEFVVGVGQNGEPK